MNCATAHVYGQLNMCWKQERRHVHERWSPTSLSFFRATTNSGAKSSIDRNYVLLRSLINSPTGHRPPRSRQQRGKGSRKRDLWLQEVASTSTI
jgi:hypothetical protein